MSKSKEITSGGLVQSLAGFDIYKRTQGKTARQVTGWVIGLTFLAMAYQITIAYATNRSVGWTLATIVSVLGVWFAFRIVNYPPFADFLIATEAEMNKVTWPTGRQLMLGSAVVLTTMFFLAAVLFLYDTVWYAVLHAAGVVITR